jgi:hypothetical protein
VQAIDAGDRPGINALFDLDAMIEKAIVSLSLPDKESKGASDGLRRSLDSDTGLAAQWIALNKQGCRFKRLRTAGPGRATVLIRVIPSTSGEGTISYCRLYLQQGEDGSARAVDIYPFLTAEMFSETLRRMLMPLAADLSRSFLDKLIGGQSDFVKDMPKLAEISQLTVRGDHRRALEMFKSLRPGTLKDKYVLLMRLRAEQSADERAYAATLGEFRSLFPDDRAVDLLSIDYYFVRKDYGKVVECIDRVDQLIGGDPYLRFLRANMEVARNDNDAARLDLVKAIEQEPDLPDPYLLLSQISAVEGNFDEVFRLLEKLDQVAPAEVNGLLKQPQLAPFLQSAQYRQWTDFLKRKPAGRKGAKPVPATGQPPGKTRS